MNKKNWMIPLGLVLLLIMQQVQIYNMKAVQKEIVKTIGIIAQHEQGQDSLFVVLGENDEKQLKSTTLIMNSLIKRWYLNE